MLTSTARRYFYYSMRTHLTLESTEHTIPSIVSTSFLVQNISESKKTPFLTNTKTSGRSLRIGFQLDGCHVSIAKTLRPAQGYKSCNHCNARKHRWFHDCFRHLLHNWDDDPRDTQNIVWKTKRRQIRFIWGGLIGDQPVNTKTLFLSKNI
jgi:hypothetical protein